LDVRGGRAVGSDAGLGLWVVVKNDSGDDPADDVAAYDSSANNNTGDNQADLYVDDAYDDGDNQADLYVDVAYDDGDNQADLYVVVAYDDGNNQAALFADVSTVSDDVPFDGATEIQHLIIVRAISGVHIKVAVTETQALASGPTRRVPNWREPTGRSPGKASPRASLPATTTSELATRRMRHWRSLGRSP
jgi:hypothetical protein